MKGEERRIAQGNDLFQQFNADVVGSAKLGGKIMGGGGALARQHEAYGDFNIFCRTNDIGNLCKLFAAVHDIAVAFVDLVGISDFTARLDRIVVVEAGVGHNLGDRGHLMHRGHIPGLYASVGQYPDDLR